MIEISWAISDAVAAINKVAEAINLFTKSFLICFAITMSYLLLKTFIGRKRKWEKQYEKNN